MQEAAMKTANWARISTEGGEGDIKPEALWTHSRSTARAIDETPRRLRRCEVNALSLLASSATSPPRSGTRQHSALTGQHRFCYGPCALHVQGSLAGLSV